MLRGWIIAALALGFAAPSFAATPDSAGSAATPRRARPVASVPT
jgi:hypothetical protein